MGARSYQIAHHDPVRMPLANRQLVDPDETINDEGLLDVAGGVCTGMTQLLSHPGHIALDAGRAFTMSLWDFIALTAALGH